jgi:hypothetical protein
MYGPVVFIWWLVGVSYIYDFLIYIIRKTHTQQQHVQQNEN